MCSIIGLKRCSATNTLAEGSTQSSVFNHESVGGAQTALQAGKTPIKLSQFHFFSEKGNKVLMYM